MHIYLNQPHPVRERMSPITLSAEEQAMVDRELKALAKVSLRPVNKNHRVEFFEQRKVNAHVIQQVICQPNELLSRTKKMTQTSQEAIELINRVEAHAAESIERLITTTQRFEDVGKQLSAKVRSHAETMAAGVRRIQKTADFNEMERQVVLLERMATAMSTLADLEQRGMLAKVSSAMR